MKPIQFTVRLQRCRYASGGGDGGSYMGYQMINDIPELVGQRVEYVCYSLIWERQRAADFLFDKLVVDTVSEPRV